MTGQRAKFEEYVDDATDLLERVFKSAEGNAFNLFIIWFRHQGYSNEEIATKLHVTRATIHKRLRRMQAITEALDGRPGLLIPLIEKQDRAEEKRAEYRERNRETINRRQRERRRRDKRKKDE